MEILFVTRAEVPDETTLSKLKGILTRLATTLESYDCTDVVVSVGKLWVERDEGKEPSEAER